ncbi:hypothetical protein K8Z61_08605 [Nocardioides sp. TRM66260-LWL]|uniref:hypothetical protein n=1 Tax=Nocardioides sp. TRM66260-LWL TaxID=2874478 RepID=UPI001CC817CF|nr:hypothetical protein [Nocardioides sp. TRM66260-LWL]MBZ5734558.1 hypothetical protein [Nocardioides sp. TRM66260-LWL]
MPSLATRRRITAILATALATGPLLGAVASADPGPPSTRSIPAAGEGFWAVRPDGPGRWQVAWTSPTPLPIGSDRPRIVVDGAGRDVRVGPVTLTRTRVGALVTADEAPRVRDLDVVLSGDRLDEPGDDRAAGSSVGGASPRGAARDAAPTTLAGVPVDPGVPGPYTVVSSDDTLPSVRVPGVPQPIEMVEHVVEPSLDAGPAQRPLVLILHGRHQVCYTPKDDDQGSDWPCVAPSREIESQLGYDYLQRLLASQGFTTVSVRVNGINAQDYRLADGGADARARLVRAHLDHWATIAAAHRVDLRRVVLIGHSRGGEGVDRAALQIPLSAPYRVVGQVLIAPTDFAVQAAPYVPTVVLLPSCDGDVSDLEGQRFVDAGRDVVRDDTALRSAVLIRGANHNFFNTEWTPGQTDAPATDDWGDDPKSGCGAGSPGRLDDAQQRAVGATYVAGATRLLTGEDDLLPMFDGRPVSLPSAGPAQVLSAAIGGGRDTRRPRVDAGLSLPRGAQTSLCLGQVASDSSRTACGQGLTDWPTTAHWRVDGGAETVRSFLALRWTRAGQSGGLALRRPLDLRTRRLELRTLLDPGSVADGSGDVPLDVRLTDADGTTAVLAPEQPLQVLREGMAHVWGQTLAVEPSTAPGLDPALDLRRIVAVDLVSRTPRGRLWVADLSAAPTADLAPVPERRVGLVSVRSASTVEGDGRPSLRHLRLRVDVRGLTRPARVLVQLVGAERGQRERFPIDLAPGQTTASISVPYRSDRRDDESRLATQVALWPSDGAMTDAYLATATVTDDDPPPHLSVRARRTSVVEGRPIVFELRTDRPSDRVYVWETQIVAAPHELHGGDVDPRWLQEHACCFAEPDGPDAGRGPRIARPLSALQPYLNAVLQPGQRRATVVIPTRRDAVREGVERLTVRFTRGTRSVVRTVLVRDAG